MALMLRHPTKTGTTINEEEPRRLDRAPGAKGNNHMNHDTSYMNTNYARDKSIESYRIEEKEKLTAKEEKGATTGGVHASPPAPEKEDDETSN